MGIKLSPIRFTLCNCLNRLSSFSETAGILQKFVGSSLSLDFSIFSGFTQNKKAGREIGFLYLLVLALEIVDSRGNW